VQTARLIGLAGFVMGLLSGVALAQPGATPVVLNVDEDGVQRATVVLDSYLFDPHHLVVHVGTPVELELTSVTLITPHNFVLADPAAGMDVNQSVGAGDSAAVRFTPTKPGIYTFYCDKQLLFFPSHREEGMEGRLEVRE
jgi:plastocyanin